MWPGEGNCRSGDSCAQRRHVGSQVGVVRHLVGSVSLPPSQVSGNAEEKTCSGEQNDQGDDQRFFTHAVKPPRLNSFRQKYLAALEPARSMHTEHAAGSFLGQIINGTPKARLIEVVLMKADDKQIGTFVF